MVKGDIVYYIGEFESYYHQQYEVVKVYQNILGFDYWYDLKSLTSDKQILSVLKLDMEMVEDKVKRIYEFNSYKVHNNTNFDLSTVGKEGYGETGFDSINELVTYFNGYFNEKTIFYDLGSGIGKIVYHIALMYNVKKSCGIEFSYERYLMSEKIKVIHNIINTNIEFINDNILNCNISDATVIYIDNTLFPNNINNIIYNLIPKNCLVISRKLFKESKINNEIVKDKVSVMTNYGVNTTNIFIKK